MSEWPLSSEGIDAGPFCRVSLRRPTPAIRPGLGENTGSDAPFAELADGQGQPVGMTGGRRGRVTGTFFHAIAAV